MRGTSCSQTLTVSRSLALPSCSLSSYESTFMARHLQCLNKCRSQETSSEINAGLESALRVGVLLLERPLETVKQLLKRSLGIIKLLPKSVLKVVKQLLRLFISSLVYNSGTVSDSIYR